MNISKKERDGHWYVPGKTNVEKQHLTEHEALQLLQRHALNNDVDAFAEVLNQFPPDKQRDLVDMCWVLTLPDHFQRPPIIPLLIPMLPFSKRFHPYHNKEDAFSIIICFHKLIQNEVSSSLTYH